LSRVRADFRRRRSPEPRCLVREGQYRGSAGDRRAVHCLTIPTLIIFRSNIIVCPNGALQANALEEVRAARALDMEQVGRGGQRGS
jgi:hypothetical protein